MGLEVAAWISQLVATNPVGASDGLNTADDHIRLIKSVLKGTFANISGAVTPTQVELNYVNGVTSALQTQLNAKLASASYTAADVLTKVKTVDGAGSGLDADLLDGLSSASFRDASLLTGSAPLADALSTGLASPTNPPFYAARAFARFTNNASGTLINNGNATVARNSSGLYTITFGTAMPTTGYAVVFGAQQIAGNPSIQAQIAQGTSPGTGSFQVEVTNGSSRVELGGSVHLVVFC